MTIWFRPPVRCDSIYDAWSLMWDWIGRAHSEGWYRARLGGP